MLGGCFSMPRRVERLTQPVAHDRNLFAGLNSEDVRKTVLRPGGATGGDRSKNQWSRSNVERPSLGVILASSLAAICLAGGTHAQAPQKLKIAEVVRSQLFAPMYLAMSEGFMKEQGIDVELVTAIGGDRVGALIVSGQADVGLAGPEVAIYIYNSLSPDKPVMFCSVNGTDGFFFVSRDKVSHSIGARCETARSSGGVRAAPRRCFSSRF